MGFPVEKARSLGIKVVEDQGKKNEIDDGDVLEFASAHGEQTRIVYNSETRSLLDSVLVANEYGDCFVEEKTPDGRTLSRIDLVWQEPGPSSGRIRGAFFTGDIRNYLKPSSATRVAKK